MSEFYPSLPDAELPRSPAARMRRRVLLGTGGVVLAFLVVSVAGFDPTGVGGFIKDVARAAVFPRPHAEGDADTAANLLIGVGPLLSAAAMTVVLSLLRFRWAVIVAVVVGVLLAGFIVQTLFVQANTPDEYREFRTWYLFALFSSIAGACGTALGCAIAYARERL